METENTPVVEQDMYEAPVESVAESAPEPVTEPEVKATGRDATEAAFDQVVAKNEPKADEAVEDPKTEEVDSGDKGENLETEEETNTTQTKGLDPTGRGPNSWKAPVREKFKTLPADVQNEVLRRENEHQKLMTETTNLRKFGDEFMNAVRPYEAMLNSLGVHPIAAFQDLMNSAYTLKTADQATKGKVIANIIKTHGVDLNAIDQALSGTQEQVDPRTAAIQQELNQLKQWKQQEESQRTQQMNQTVEQQIHTFANDPSNEFFHDVVGDMQILLNTGRAQSLQDAYDMACHMNPDVRGVLSSRSVQRAAPVQQAPQQNVTTQQKVAASSGVKGAPAVNRPAPAKKQLSGAAAAMAAWDLHERKSRT